MVRSPVEICRGTSPSQAAKSRPLENTSPLPIAATMALEMIGPMPGTVIRRSHAGSFSTKLVMSADKPSTRSSSRRQSPARSSMMRIMRGDSTSERLARMPRNSALQQEGTNLIDDAGALPDQPLAHPVQRLQVKLIGRLGGDKLHRRALHRFSDRLGIAEIVFLPFAICPHIFRRHQSRIVTVCLQLAAQVMGANAGFHANQAPRHVDNPRFDLAA